MGSFKGKTLLITGGTGSFGCAMVKKMRHSGLEELRIFSRDEKKQEDMRLQFSDEKLKFVIGDVRDYDSISEACDGVDFIFHAAALKQVPSCEFYPLEAVKTNILGAENVMSAALKNNVERVVLLSTDKAVYPINAMGISKAMMEKLMLGKSLHQSTSNTTFCATRYGNVMGSRGSVIPRFVELIKSAQTPLITDPAMTRFLMSLDESLELVLHAFKEGKQGDIFVQKSPASTLADLVQAINEELGCENNFQIIGTRHGEKLFETLLSREEMSRAEDNNQYFRIPSDNRNLNYEKYFTSGQVSVSSEEDYTSHNTRRLSIKEIRSLLSEHGLLKG
ncbi:polysaccharide biosynthesis protein [Alphaproteobacteria bacterium]|nr:polysaccharide biosynthesis protein [Alphaproteobacteria bacterium]